MCMCLRYWIPGAAFLLEDEPPDKGVRHVSVPLKIQYSLLITEPIPFLSAKIFIKADVIFPIFTCSLYRWHSSPHQSEFYAN